MSTAFFQVVSAVKVKLEGQPPVCKSIHRARATPVPDQEAEAVNVQWEQAVPAQGGIKGAPVDWSTRVIVECFARSVTESGDVAVDPLLERVVARLAEDPSLDGLVDDLVLMGLEAENTADGKKTGWVRLIYAAEHRTYNGNLN